MISTKPDVRKQNIMRLFLPKIEISESFYHTEAYMHGNHMHVCPQKNSIKRVTSPTCEVLNFNLGSVRVPANFTLPEQ